MALGQAHKSTLECASYFFYLLLHIQAAFLTPQEQDGLPSSMPLQTPDSRSTCLLYQLGAQGGRPFSPASSAHPQLQAVPGSKGSAQFCCMTVRHKEGMFCLSFFSHEAVSPNDTRPLKTQGGVPYTLHRQE